MKTSPLRKPPEEKGSRSRIRPGPARDRLAIIFIKRGHNETSKNHDYDRNDFGNTNRSIATSCPSPSNDHFELVNWLRHTLHNDTCTEHYKTIPPIHNIRSKNDKNSLKYVWEPMSENDEPRAQFFLEVRIFGTSTTIVFVRIFGALGSEEDNSSHDPGYSD